MSANIFVPDHAAVISRECAKKGGRKRFFTGIPCKNGHTTERYVSGGQCCACLADAFRSYRASNLEKERTRRKSYYASTRDKELQRYEENREAILAAQKASRDKDRKAVRAAQNARRTTKQDQYRNSDRLYRQNNRATIRSRQNAWECQHPEARKPKKHRRRARLKGASGNHSPDDIRRIHRLQKGKCAMCRISLRNRYEVDHINPLARGGSNDASNLQLLCKPCNASKAARDPLDFARRTGRLL